MADFTKSQGQVLDWTALPVMAVAGSSPSVDTGVQTVAANLVTTLNIVVAHADANDASTSYATVKVFVRTSADAEGWRLHAIVQSGGGLAVKEDLVANSGASQANPNRIEVADTTDWDTGLGEVLFLLDTTTVADSCLVQIKGWLSADYYIAMDNLVRNYDSADDLLSGVYEHEISLPEGAQYYRVVFSNSHTTATYAVRVDYSTVTEIV